MSDDSERQAAVAASRRETVGQARAARLRAKQLQRESRHIREIVSSDRFPNAAGAANALSLQPGGSP